MADRIITFSGKQFCGKDTVAKILLEHFSTFKRLALGDAIKLEYSRQTGLSLEEIEKNKSVYRPDLIALGDKGRATHPDYWLNKVLNEPGDLIVPDVRVIREFELFKQHKAFCIRVESSREARAKRGLIVKEDDLTETMLDDIQGWDYIVHNDGTYAELLENSELLIVAVKNYFSLA